MSFYRAGRFVGNSLGQKTSVLDLVVLLPLAWKGQWRGSVPRTFWAKVSAVTGSSSATLRFRLYRCLTLA
jgi:hypothetical protein